MRYASDQPCQVRCPLIDGDVACEGCTCLVPCPVAYCDCEAVTCLVKPTTTDLCYHKRNEGDTSNTREEDAGQRLGLRVRKSVEVAIRSLRRKNR